MIERDDHQIDEEMILIDEVADEALEAAAFVALGGLPTIMYRTYCSYCFTCPSDPLRKLLSRDEVALVSCLVFSSLRHVGRRHLSLIPGCRASAATQ